MIDNDVYDRLGDSWWDENNPLNVLHGMTPGRLAYFREAMAAHFPQSVAGLRALDVGCGGGFLAEELAQLGCRVVGVDPSSVSIRSARRHAAAVGLEIEYRVGSGERLPAEDRSFDVVLCCDVLEHVPDVDAVLAEAARVLADGGIFLFDTVNRTLRSRLIGIKVVQEWRVTRLVDVPVHDWDLFLKPQELVAALGRRGLLVGEVVGLGPRGTGARAALDVARARRGRISYGELGRRLDVGRVRSTALSYMGSATRR